MSETDNYQNWNGQPGHYEVWYLTLNHRASSTGFWIRYTTKAPLGAGQGSYAQLWFAFFDAREPSRGFAIHRQRPATTVRAAKAPFDLKFEDAMLRHGLAQGHLAGGGHEAEWRLEWVPPEQSHRHLPAFAYRSKIATTKVLSPALHAAFRGTIRADGREFRLDGEPGCQTHLWGRKHAHAWAWAHCNAFHERPDAALEALTIRIKRAGLALPRLSMLSLYLDGEKHHFRDLCHLPFTRGSWRTGGYRVVGRSLKTRVEAEFTCRPVDLVRAPYYDPDGERAFCHNTEVADCRVRVSRRQGLCFKPYLELTSRSAAHFEVAGRAPDNAVTRQHKLIE